MIVSFEHKGLREFYLTGTTKGIQVKHRSKLRNILAVLDSIKNINDANFPSFKLHKLKGNQKDKWSIWVSGNWRITFIFNDGDVHIVNYVDYH